MYNPSRMRNAICASDAASRQSEAVPGNAPTPPCRAGDGPRAGLFYNDRKTDRINRVWVDPQHGPGLHRASKMGIPLSAYDKYGKWNRSSGEIPR